MIPICRNRSRSTPLGLLKVEATAISLSMPFAASQSNQGTNTVSEDAVAGVEKVGVGGGEEKVDDGRGSKKEIRFCASKESL